MVGALRCCGSSPSCKGSEAADAMLHHFASGGGPRDGQRLRRSPRVLIYSHDTFGLGHLRRSRAIANRLVLRHPTASVVIISGSPIIGSFEFGDGVDYV